MIGAGTISANGGKGRFGGGGGRIGFGGVTKNQFTGTVQVNGGKGGKATAGTIHRK